MLTVMPSSPLDPIADLPRNGHGAAEKPHAAAHIRPAFIQAKRLDLVGVVLQNLPHIAAVPHILAVVRRHDDKVAAAFLALPKSPMPVLTPIRLAE